MYVAVQVCLKAGKDQYPCLKTERVGSFLPSRSTQIFNRLDEAHLYLGGQSVSLSLLIQWLIVPRNILIDSLEIMFTKYLGTLWLSHIET